MRRPTPLALLLLGILAPSSLLAATDQAAPAASASLSVREAGGAMVACRERPFIHDLPNEPRFYRQVLFLASPGGNEAGRLEVAGIAQGVVQPAGWAAASRSAECAIRVLADLGDDGRLAPSEGVPALAALLGAETPSGTISADLGVQAFAAWALAEGAEALPADPWVRESAEKAIADLTVRAVALGESGGGGPGDVEPARWARLVLGWLRPAKALKLEAPAGDPSPAYFELVQAISAPTAPDRAWLAPTPWARLLRSVRLGHLRCIR
jgi:hypothetical protein